MFLSHDFTARCWRRHWLGVILALALFVALLLLTGGLYAGGHIHQAMNPDISKDAFWARLTVPPGTASAETRRLAERVERELLRYRDELEAADPGFKLLIGQETLIWDQEAGLWLELSEQARQRIKADDFVREWRHRIGAILVLRAWILSFAKAMCLTTSC